MFLRSFNHPTFYIRHHNFEAELNQLPPEGSKEREDFAWFEEELGKDGDVTLVRFRALQTFNNRSHFLRHQNFRLVLQPDDGTQQFDKDSTFRRFRGLSDDPDKKWKSYEAFNFQDHWIRHHSFHLFVNQRAATDKDFNGDATFVRDQSVD